MKVNLVHLHAGNAGNYLAISVLTSRECFRSNVTYFQCMFANAYFQRVDLSWMIQKQCGVTMLWNGMTNWQLWWFDGCFISDNVHRSRPLSWRTADERGRDVYRWSWQISKEEKYEFYGRYRIWNQMKRIACEVSLCRLFFPIADVVSIRSSGVAGCLYKTRAPWNLSI